MSNTGSVSKPATEKAQNKGIFARIVQFFREVIGELKRVQRPTGSELWQLFLTVVLFIVCVMVFIGIFDIAFGRGTLWIFG